LLESVPRLDEEVATRLHPIEGQPPDLANLPAGCSFRPRCPFAFDRCAQEEPPLFDSPHGGRHACFADIRAAQPTAASEEVRDG
jgi:oligopeptide transport system ATP-binding protein